MKIVGYQIFTDYQIRHLSNPSGLPDILPKIDPWIGCHVRKYSFSQRTIDVWNKLSTDCAHAGSVDMFKNGIDKYLVKAGYT